MAWETKDPNSVADYSNEWSLDGDTIATSTWTFENQAGLVIDSQTHTDAVATVWLSGGNDGQTAILINRIVTTGGRTFDSLGLALPIAQTYPAASAPTGYNPPTPAYLVLMFPQFAAVAPSTIAAYIVRANRSVDATWTQGDYAFAIMLLACHLMTLAGLGTGTEAEMNAQGMAGFSMIRSGQLTLQRAATSGGAGGEVPSEWSGSLYGKQFYALLRQNKAGPGLAAGVAPACVYPGYPGGAYPWPLW